MIRAARSFVLLIGDDGAYLQPPRHLKRTENLIALSHSDEDAAPLLRAMAETPQTPILLLADVLAQDYKRELVPAALSTLDRRKLLARRLEQYFPQMSLRAALRQKDGAALLLSLDDKGPMGLWLSRLKALHRPTGAVSLLPLESASMMPLLAPQTAQGWGLFLSWQKTGGFRQIVTLNGEVVFTRLTPPLPAVAHADYATSTLAQDIGATRGYLARMGLNENTPLHLVAVLPPALLPALRDAPLDVASRTLYAPHEAAAKLNLPPTLKALEPMADGLHALWAQRKPHLRTVLMKQETRRTYRADLIGRTGRALALAACLWAFFAIAWDAGTLWRIAHKNVGVRREIAALRTQFEEAKSTLALKAKPVVRLRKAVERRRLFTQNRADPFALAPAIAQALEGEAYATSLGWQDGTLTLDLKLADREAADLSRGESAQADLAQRFDDIAARLQDNLPGLSVSIARYPFPNLPNETLTNRENASRKETAAQIVLRKEAAP